MAWIWTEADTFSDVGSCVVSVGWGTWLLFPYSAQRLFLFQMCVYKCFLRDRGDCTPSQLWVFLYQPASVADALFLTNFLCLMNYITSDSR